MTARRLLGTGCAALLLAIALPVGAVPEQKPKPGRVPPVAPDHDLRGIRDIFRYIADPAPAGAPARAFDSHSAEAEEEEAPVARARLVGLVERAGRFVAALAIDGEVTVLGAGQSAVGFTVLEVTEETVRLRTPEGDEQILALP